MSRHLSFFEPPGNFAEQNDLGFIRVCLFAIGHDVPPATVGSWTVLERLLAYDYSVRVRLHAEARAHECAAAPVELRPCPSFVTAGDVHRSARCIWVQLMMARELVW